LNVSIDLRSVKNEHIMIGSIFWKPDIVLRGNISSIKEVRFLDEE